MSNRPLAIDLYCGLGGWADGFLAEGYNVVGFDIERHDYGTGGYPGRLVLQDVLTLHGSQLKDAAVIVASPPCQAYSYRAMPWKRAKALPPPDNSLFDACFRIQREACEAAGRHIPMIVENVCGAQKWVGKATWHYGSYYLWGDIPALMPPGGHRKFQCHTRPRLWREREVPRLNDGEGLLKPNGTGSTSWFFKTRTDPRDIRGVKQEGSGQVWFDIGFTKLSSRSEARKAASAMIAKIPFALAQHIARVFKPQ